MKNGPNAFISLFVVLFLLGCGDNGKSAGDESGDRSGGKKPGQQRGDDKSGMADTMENRREQFRNRPVPVAVAVVHRGRVDAFYSSTTSLTAKEEAVVVARTQGVVEEIFVEEGDHVAIDTPLAQLDTNKLELEVARTNANLKSLERAYERAEQLMGSKMISPDAYDKVRFDLEREQATLALQMHDLKEATIRAPINGVITLRHIKLGHTLSPNSRAFEIKRTDSLEAILNVPERELIKLSKGQLAEVSVDALGRQTFPGTVDRIAPEVDASSGTFRVTVVVRDEEQRLKPGMFTRVNILFDSNENTLLVARQAIVTQKDESTVFVVRDGLATRQVVVTGYTQGESVEILNGLGEGDQVVMAGQGGLRDGAAVRVVSL